ncbi:SurA N-terminal domain-containing protein, partial [uncultured Sulfitobacter sp.]|uniref:SurA N-terminal domain-containing protein n=1 Tax=uncultured Sulfitobacter sp. TaxID=191468 RepID=UPI0025945028
MDCTVGALDNEATNLGISVGDARVRDEVLKIPAFRGLSGDFDRESYRFALSQSGLSEAEFETSLREDIARTLLQGAVVGGVPAPEAYAQALSQFIGEARAITYAMLTADDLTAPVAGATPEDLQNFLQKEQGFRSLSPKLLGILQRIHKNLHPADSLRTFISLLPGE